MVFFTTFVMLKPDLFNDLRIGIVLAQAY